MKIFGFSILIFSILLCFIPLAGGYFTWIPAFMALFVGRPGIRYALIGVIVNGVHVMVFSDFMRFNAKLGLQHGQYLPATVYITLALLQVVVGLVLWFRHEPVASNTRKTPKG
ncbi:MAG: hypothetical protein H7839_09375 [Magnetococcus sp. YQC-5]